MDIMYFYTLLLGWLFGMLSPVIVNRIQKKYSKEELHEGIFNEFYELRYILIHSCYIDGSKAGKINKKYLEWFVHIVDSFYESRSSESPIIVNIKKVLDSEKVDETLAIYQQAEARRNKALSLKKIAITFTEANLSEIAVFNKPFQALLFEVRRQINAYNDEVEKAEKFFLMTFDSSMTPQNYDIINKSIFEKYGHTHDIGIKLVNIITELLELKKY